ncbi:hypothetical protein B1C78_06055 [Thioalkalivibrio denitrificans]|uniref:Uncharacterized protein n=1 Tax=Thioalkalivibrio denitrificans TaxID=108003 RepID=A0A1V3NKM1_9GAMM|nr:hypothetical protein [Thioalkalivibrio denitrificans]OOG25667.1 hypothetical protein B1C78_06055 [Thioalkalivibrio denitrificans]
MSLSPIQAALLPPPIRIDTDPAWHAPVRGEAQRGGEEPVRRPTAPTGGEHTAEQRRDRREREMLGRLRVALAEPETRPANVMRRGSQVALPRTPADALDQRISALLGDSGSGSLRRLDVRA